MSRAVSIAIFLGAAIVASIATAEAGDIVTTVHRVTQDGVGKEVGQIRFEDARFGLVVKPDFHGLTAGPHALHIHQFPNCDPARSNARTVPAGAAGGHYDPRKAGRHAGPYGDGHLGDLPNLHVESDGTASIPVLAPRLKTRDIHGRALVVHAAPDRYADHGHHAHGKGGIRMYCGIIK